MQLPENGDKFIGLSNYGNTCYCNSVLQALFSCEPFRKRIIELPLSKECAKEVRGKEMDGREEKMQGRRAIVEALQELYTKIVESKKRIGVAEPKKFIAQVRKQNGVFATLVQQDAHEFFNYLLNEVDEYLEKVKGEEEGQQGNVVREQFRGMLVSETKCLCCERVTQRKEEFLDLSVDIEVGASLTSCLCKFSSMEILAKRDKFFCEACNCLQEAEKR